MSNAHDPSPHTLPRDERPILRAVGAIERRARAICEIGLRASDLCSDRELGEDVDRYWPVFAAELKVGVINLAARHSLAGLEVALAACRRWQDRGA